MANALMKNQSHVNAVQLDIKDALSAAILRVQEAGEPKTSLFSLITNEEWKNMDEREENIMVSDPE